MNQLNNQYSYYQWSDGSNSWWISVYNSGTYYVTITDNNGCTGVDSIAVTVIPTVNLTPTNTSCVGNDGTIQNVVTGGTGVYTYLWSNGSTNANLNGLTPGTYYVTVTDNDGCTATANTNVGGGFPDFLTLTPTATTCDGGNTGSITSSQSGGNDYYDYWNGFYYAWFEWTGPDGFSQSGYGYWGTGTITNLASGTYYLTVTEQSGCSQTDSAVVIGHTPLYIPIDFTVNNSSCAGNDGIDILVNNGTGTYTYNWAGPNDLNSNSENLSGLIPGTYYLTVSEGSACMQAQTTVGGNATIKIASTPTITACSSNQNSINNYISGGENVNGWSTYNYDWTGPYGYTNSGTDYYNWGGNWDYGYSSISNLLPGVYYITVTDVNSGCTKTDSVLIPGAQPVPISFTTTEVSCIGDDGEITATVNDGSGVYSYTWTGPDNFTGNSASITNLVPGDYYLTVTNNNGCTQTNTTVSGYAPITINLVPNTTPCASNQNSIASYISGGTNYVSYVWSGPFGYTNSGTAYIWYGNTNYSGINNLLPGTYYITVKDENTGCMATDSATITGNQPVPVNFIVTNTNGCGGNDGAITPIVNNGAGSYTYSWSGPNGYTSTYANIDSLYEGEYYLTVTYADGCTQTDTTVGGYEPITIDLYPNTTPCASNENSIESLISGGTSYYYYVWAGPYGYRDSGYTYAYYYYDDYSSISNLLPGTYYITVTDYTTGCTLTDSATITGNQPLPVSFIVTDANGCGGNDGAITPIVNNGSGEYTYSWTGPNNFTSTSPEIDSLAQGEYYLTVTYADGCTQSDTTVGGLQPITIQLTPNPTPCASAENSISSYINGGTDYYSFVWAGPNGYRDSGFAYAYYYYDINSSISNLLPGTYYITVTDFTTGCQQTASTTISGAEPVPIRSW